MSKTIIVKVVPRAKRENIKEEGGVLKIYMLVPAIEGRANKKLIDMLAQYWGVRKSSLTIIKGLKSRIKTISIEAV